MRDVHGAAPDAVWMVGNRSALLWNGKDFARHTVAGDGELEAVFALASNDVWAVSDTGQVAHFDGALWTQVAAPHRGWLLTVWGAKSNDVWAAGGSSEVAEQRHVLHWDGHQWQQVPLPIACSIEALTGTASDDVWAAADWGRLLHWDGHSWTQVPSPAWRGLNGAWALASNDVWVVGEDGIVLHFDGMAWSGAKPDWRWLRSVTATTGRELFAVGEHGTVLHWKADAYGNAPPIPPRPVAKAATARLTADEAQKLAPEYAKALARARLLQSQGKLDQANDEFIAASGRGQVVNLRPIVERAHLLLDQALNNPGGGGDAAIHDYQDQFYAGTNDGDTELQAQAWYNLATVYAHQVKPERERAALARSLLFREHVGVKTKLGARAGCSAELVNASGPVVVTGWQAVCRHLGLCQPNDVLDEDKSRAAACLTCSFSAATPDESHGCAGDGPWESTFGYAMYAFEQAWIAPAANKRFFVDHLRTGAWPSVCRGSVTPSWQLDGKWVVARYHAEPMSTVPGRATPQGDADEGVCLDLPRSTTTAVYALATGKLLAAVDVVDHHGVNVGVNSERAQLELSGGGCDGYSIPLDGSSRFARVTAR